MQSCVCGQVSIPLPEPQLGAVGAEQGMVPRTCSMESLGCSTQPLGHQAAQLSPAAQSVSAVLTSPAGCAQAIRGDL